MDVTGRGKRGIKYNVEVLDLSDWVNSCQKLGIVEEQGVVKLEERYIDFEVPAHYPFGCLIGR